MVAGIFVYLFIILFDIPAAIVALIFSAKRRGSSKIPSTALAGLAIGFSLCSLTVLHYVSGWVRLILFILIMFLAAVSLILAFTGGKEQNNTFDYTKVYSSDEGNSEEVEQKDKVTIKENYIEEIKQLKELVDCGVLTQEEFDKKKKEILERK